MADVEINMEDENKETEQPANTPDSQTPAEPKPTDPQPEIPPKPGTVISGGEIKRSKRPLIVLIILVLFLGVGGWWKFFRDKKDNPTGTSNTSASKTSTPTTKTQLLVYQDPTLYAIDGMTKTQLATVEPNSVPLRYVDGNAGKGVLYYGLTDPANTSVISEVKKNDGAKTTSVYTPPKNTTVDGVAVSPDGKTLAVSLVKEPASPSDDVVTVSLVTINDGSSKNVELSKALYKVADFASNNQLILQAMTCYFCDGPPLAKIAVVDTTKFAISKTYQVDEGDPSAGMVQVDPNGKGIYIAENKTKYGMAIDKATAEGDQFKINAVDVNGDKNLTIYTKQSVSDVNPTLLGENYQSGKLYFSVDSATDKADGSGADLKFAKLVEAAKGAKSDIKLEFTTLQKGGYLSQAYSLDGKILYLVLNTNVAPNKSSLVSLPYADEGATTTNILEPASASIRILGTLTTKK